MFKFNINEIDAFVFDWDDTCVATLEPKSRQHQEVAREHYGIDLSLATIKQHWGKPLDELFKVLYETEDLKAARQYAADRNTTFPKKPFSHTERVFNLLAQPRGILKGLVTATSRASLQEDEEITGMPELFEHFDYTQTADATAHHKPNPKVFTPTLDWLANKGVREPGRVVYVGDGLHDMKAALGAGFHFIGMATGLTSLDEFKEAGAVNVFEGMAGLHSALENALNA